MKFIPGFRFSFPHSENSMDDEYQRFLFHVFLKTRCSPRQGRWIKNRLKIKSNWRLFFFQRAKRPLIGQR